jgi:2,5-diketo-D-gluconate reductase B
LAQHHGAAGRNPGRAHRVGAHGIAITAYSPTARGTVLENETMRRIGEKHGKNAVQIALRWLVEQPGVIAIPRSSSDKNIRANFEIFDFALDDADRAAIAGLDRQERLVDPEWAPVWDKA